MRKISVTIAALALLSTETGLALAQQPGQGPVIRTPYALLTQVYGPKPWRHLDEMPDKQTCINEAERFLDYDEFPEVKDAPIVAVTCVFNRAMAARMENQEPEIDDAPHFEVPSRKAPKAEKF